MNNIKFLGYCADGSFKKACRHRENPLESETFYTAVNQSTSSGCSCCKQEDVIVYAVQSVGLPVKPSVISLCAECLSKLPVELEVINLDSNAAPPLLINI